MEPKFVWLLVLVLQGPSIYLLERWIASKRGHVNGKVMAIWQTDQLLLG
jgi:hypothetical protein